MDPLPTVPTALPASCELDADGVREQTERYRRIGAASELLERSDARLRLRLGEEVDVGEVERLIAVERECCPFFELDWDPVTRTFEVGVARSDDEPALDAIAYALGVAEPTPTRRS